MSDEAYEAFMEANYGPSTQEYHVVWRIEVEADNPTEAAVQAREILLDPESEAVVFDVTPFKNYRIFGDAAKFETIDLSE